MDSLAGLWNDLSYLDGIIVSIYLGIMYYGKCWIDHHFSNKE